ncbi:hypothetical protein A2U01_0034024, partial [Trifolium medium]|nr:hypothetical protein [Trifolium medium]
EPPKSLLLGMGVMTLGLARATRSSVHELVIALVCASEEMLACRRSFYGEETFSVCL